MSIINTYEMKHSTILRIYSERDCINTKPEYQRNGEVWTLEKKQLLMDSILNDYDIPKIYFHLLNTKEANDRLYAIIDGRQRLEAIWSFMDGDFTLADDFQYLKDDKVKACGLTYSDLAGKYPKMKINFDSFELPIICVETDDIELIEDMFSRLNEAVPLNAAEKRNAFGGPMVKTIKKTSEHPFFKHNVKFTNKRYQHREAATRLLFIEYSLKHLKGIVDTKKPYLDAFVKEYKKNIAINSSELYVIVKKTLDRLHALFTKSDDLLKSQATIPIYYLLVKDLISEKSDKKLTRSRFVEFRDAVSANRTLAEKDISKANFELLEFDRMTQQGTNDAVSIRERLKIMKHFFGGRGNPEA